ncbi:hypothetical protein SAMN04488124_0921 [Halogeometricum limi]|uniref:Uncharacterized protein n=1 Tax=Halogeometricum limi TaxID=555875 RepID=A0A1I6G5Z2_9EURY|nr:hypothetical protein SAMN04488124_0921 [Halogeometricum limi]
MTSAYFHQRASYPNVGLYCILLSSLPTSDESVDTAERFTTALERLLNEATKHDVDVEGGWACRVSNPGTEYDVLVTRVERSNSDD